MSPLLARIYRQRLSFPRMRGDEPIVAAGVGLTLTFSPHARG